MSRPTQSNGETERMGTVTCPSGTLVLAGCRLLDQSGGSDLTLLTAVADESGDGRADLDERSRRTPPGTFTTTCWDRFNQSVTATYKVP